jgi:hypothetical protein
VIRFLSSLLALIERAFAYFDREHWAKQGRQEVIKEAADVVESKIELANAAVAVSDPARDERLRNRFDRTRTTR